MHIDKQIKVTIFHDCNAIDKHTFFFTPQINSREIQMDKYLFAIVPLLHANAPFHKQLLKIEIPCRRT